MKERPVRDAEVFTLQDLPPTLCSKQRMVRSFALRQHRGEVVLLSFWLHFLPRRLSDDPRRSRTGAGQPWRSGTARARGIYHHRPERDTPERLRAYTNAFDPTFVGLTGSRET